MKYYLSTWGQVDGDFQPAGTAGLNGWTCIDFRPDSTVPDGFCLVAAPDVLTIPGATLVATSSGEPLSVARQRSLANGIGLNLAASRFDEIVLELLTVHASDADVTRWNRLRPAFGRHEVWLGNQKIVDLPVVGGGAVYTESFNRADVNPLVTADLTWVDILGAAGTNFQVVSNQAQVSGIGSASYWECASDCSSSDNYGQITIVTTDTSTSSRWGVLCRYASDGTTDTAYLGRQGDGTVVNNTEIFKRVTATNTSLGTSTNTKATNEVIKISAVGSTITFYVDGVSNITLTDTAITTGTRGGMHAFIATSVTRSTMDDFSVGDMGSSFVYRPRDRRRAAVWRASYW